ncbi:MAG TPA: hypothetical protein VHO06_09255 [Polyangia bacterium]|nr:hypothetical protein [Polyangia bacterium]
MLDDLGPDAGRPGTGGASGSGGSGGPIDASTDARCFGNQPQPIGAVADQPVVLVALDRSAEMTMMGTQFGSNSEFSEAVTDLSAQVGSYAPSGQHLNRRSLVFGYLEFPEGDDCGAAGCCASDGRDTDSYQDFTNATMSCQSSANTCGPSTNHPVAAALSKAQAFFNFGSGAVQTTERYVLLVTDDLPSGGCSLQENDCQLAEDQAYDLAMSNVTTVVVHVGASTNTGCLQNLADIQGAPPPYYGDSTLYYNAPMADDLQTTIAKYVIPAMAQGACRFTLTNTPSDPSALTVSQGMTTVPQDPKNGWTYVGDSGTARLILHGTACNNFLGSQFGGLTVSGGCVPNHPGQTP